MWKIAEGCDRSMICEKVPSVLSSWTTAKPSSRDNAAKRGASFRYTISSLRPSDAYICISKLTIIVSDNGLSPGRRQAIIWTNAGILLIRTLGTNFSEILSEIRAFSFKKMHLKMSSVKWRPFCLGLNVLTKWPQGDLTKMLEM